ncbi:uncharacterized protein LOC125213842 [Salvia hispanica]|uniref:uncharacterized protein LOC125213842 n=1 Tax=Salvia hispanica TaxID=49212 RepID=UPI002008FA38|nr:uncharacterized protein LOC125213842 [Salvia hispanica]
MMVSYLQIEIRFKNPPFLFPSDDCTLKKQSHLKSQTSKGRITSPRYGNAMVCSGIMFPIDSWAAADVDSPAIASQLSAFSLLPYMGFLYFITKSKSAPPLTLFGFYFLLAFVAAAIPAGIYAKVHYGKSLANVDWLHGGAESLLMLTNLFIVVGLRKALREAEHETTDVTSNVKDEEKSSV